MRALALGILAAAIGFALNPLGVAKAQNAGAEGIDVVDVVKTTATVEKIDLDKRKVALLFDDGKKKTLKVDKSVRNLDQVKVGDHLKLTYAEDIAVLVGKTKETVGTEDVGLTSIVPKGSKPGGVMVDTTSLTAKVLSVDPEHRRAVVEEPDGHKKTIKFGKKVTNLDQLQPGETVDVVMTEELVIEVTR
jgi:hypothetical protein